MSSGVMGLGGLCSISTPFYNVVNIYVAKSKNMKTGKTNLKIFHIITMSNRTGGIWHMNRKLIIDGNAIYEIDEDCMLKNRVDGKEDEKEEGTGKKKDKDGNGK